jgi:hypothetical protein
VRCVGEREKVTGKSYGEKLRGKVTGKMLEKSYGENVKKF